MMERHTSTFIALFVMLVLHALGIESSFINVVCDMDSECGENSDCQPSPCPDGMRMCKCRMGWYPDNTQAKCLKVRHLGESCDSNFRCSDSHMGCIKGECKCTTSFEPTEDGLACKPSPLHGHVKFAALGESCDGKAAICHQSYEQECVAGKCGCRKNLRPLTRDEIYSHIDLPSKCTLIGKDPEFHCPRRIHPEL